MAQERRDPKHATPVGNFLSSCGQQCKLPWAVGHASIVNVLGEEGCTYRVAKTTVIHGGVCQIRHTFQTDVAQTLNPFPAQQAHQGLI
jgi:NADH:ubiquinone oxidoreductase subunit D